LTKKKSPQPKKKRPEKRGLIEQFLQVLDHVFSYFEILFIYLRKSLNQSIRQTLTIVLLLIYLGLLNFTGMGFIVYSLYLDLLNVFQQNQSLASLSLGLGLFAFSGIFIAVLIRRISI